MTRRTTITLTAATLALAVALGGCQSTAGGSSSSGGSASGGTSGGDTPGLDSMGDSLPNDLGGAAATEAASSHDQHGDFGTEYNDSTEIGACRFWFGYSYENSSQYIVAADKYGIGGQMTWSCNKLNSGGAIRINLINTWLEWSIAPTQHGHWTKEPAGDGNKTLIDAKSDGTLIVFTDHCTTDAWRMAFKVEVEQANQGMVTQTVYSQWRQVTADDCARE